MIKDNKYWQNPFEKNLVEDWRLEEFPSHYEEFVSCFFPPDFMNKLRATDVKPKIVMGGRGTGKSHILRMLSIQSVFNRLKIEKANKQKENTSEISLKFSDYKEPYFGVYIKSTVFSPLSKTNITFLDEDQLKTLFEHLFNMQIGIVILDSARYLLNNLEDISKEKEELLCSELTKKFKDLLDGKKIIDLIESLKKQIDLIHKLLKEYPWKKDFRKFEDKIIFTNSPDFIINFFKVFSHVILKDKILFILLDEYDELDIYQQKFINNLIRTRTLTFRIASKIGGIKTLEYKTGEELDEVHDYTPIIPLHFETSREKIHPYRLLLKNIFIKRLEIYGNYFEKNPEKMLPNVSLESEKITKDEFNAELKKIRAGLKKKLKIQKSIGNILRGIIKKQQFIE